MPVRPKATIGPAGFLTIPGGTIIDIDVPSPRDLRGVFRKRIAFALEPALRGFGGGKAQIHRVEQALGRNGIKRQRGIADRQPILSRRRFEPGSLCAITPFAPVPPSVLQQTSEHWQSSRPRQQRRQRPPIACGGQIRIGVERQDAGARRYRRGVPPSLGFSFPRV